MQWHYKLTSFASAAAVAAVMMVSGAGIASAEDVTLTMAVPHVIAGHDVTDRVLIRTERGGGWRQARASLQCAVGMHPSDH